jgi:hypothetical protein
MSSSTAGKHAGSGAAQPAVAEPTFAERARTLVYLGRVGSLSTLSRKQQGFPFGSVMPYGSLPRNITAVNPTHWLTLQSASFST